MENKTLSGDRVLFIVDATSLLYGAMDRYGPECRIDFLKIIEKAKALRPKLDFFVPVVHIFKRSCGLNDKQSLTNYLIRQGCEVSVHDPAPDAHQGTHRASVTYADTLKRLSSLDYSDLVVASAHQEFLKRCSRLHGDTLRVSFLLYGRPVGGDVITNYHLTSDVVFQGKKWQTIIPSYQRQQ